LVIPEQFRKCVVFLFVRPDADAIQPLKAVGTAFLVGIPALGGDDTAQLAENEGWFVRYLVTARHMVALSRKHGSIYARLHLADGTTTLTEFPANSWHEHPSTEVAAVLLRESRPLDQTLISVDRFELDAVVSHHRVSIGDEVFFMGLFSEHPGVERNEPIARFGNIALMPGEKLQVDAGDAMARIRAYLVEARSWGGHSGSPAFVYFPPDRFGNSISLNVVLPVFLLGLVQGHYDIRREMKFLGDVGEIPVNAGIAVVVPAQDVYDLLMSPEAVAERAQAGQTD
jgi:hypothetical protein